jgi:hypothetical protein
MMEWQKIETAPKDGTEILGYRDDAGVILMRWTAPIYFCTENERRDLSDSCAHAEDWFYSDFIAGGRMEGSEVPTHWMPLPDSPENTDIDEAAKLRELYKYAEKELSGDYNWELLKKSVNYIIEGS